MKYFPFLLLLSICYNLEGRSPSKPFYFFIGDNPTQTTEFVVDAQQAYIRENTIGLIIQTQDDDKSDAIDYELNADGRLEGMYRYDKKSKELISSYEYNESGQITLKTWNDDGWTFKFGYSKEGRLVSYQEYSIGEKKRQDTTWYAHLTLTEENATQSILTQTSPRKGDLIRWIVDHNNRILLIENPYGTDSITVEKISENEYIRRYWYKSLEAKSLSTLGPDKYFLGGERHYKNERITKEISYYLQSIRNDKNSLRIKAAHDFIYDENGRLVAKKEKSAWGRQYYFNWHEYLQEEITFYYYNSKKHLYSSHYRYRQKGFREDIIERAERQAAYEKSVNGLLQARKWDQGLALLSENSKPTWQELETAAIILHKTVLRKSSREVSQKKYNQNKQKYLPKSLALILQSLALNENAQNTATYAQILFSLGRRKEAIETIEKALVLGEKKGLDLKNMEAYKRYYLKNKD